MQSGRNEPRLTRCERDFAVFTTHCDVDVLALEIEHRLEAGLREALDRRQAEFDRRMSDSYQYDQNGGAHIACICTDTSGGRRSRAPDSVDHILTRCRELDRRVNLAESAFDLEARLLVAEGIEMILRLKMLAEGVELTGIVLLGSHGGDQQQRQGEAVDLPAEVLEVHYQTRCSKALGGVEKQAWIGYNG